jgi:segregation and condensation protein A
VTEEPQTPTEASEAPPDAPADAVQGAAASDSKAEAKAARAAAKAAAIQARRDERDAAEKAAQYSVSLPIFEGPLDLLLHLCQKHELNILDIPISFVTEKYLAYLQLMKSLNLDLAAEYLVMAATLAHIKSKMLLPQVPTTQAEEDAAILEEEDPREALIKRLLEYQKYKQAAQELVGRGLTGADAFLRGVPIERAAESGAAPLAPVPIFSLMEAFQRLLEKTDSKVTHDIVTDRVSITDRINELVDLLRGKGKVPFEDLFAQAKSTFDLIITFLALLEMSKLRMTRLEQDGPLAQLYVEATSQRDGPFDSTGFESHFGAPKPAALSQSENPGANPGDLAAKTAADEPLDQVRLEDLYNTPPAPPVSATVEGNALDLSATAEMSSVGNVKTMEVHSIADDQIDPSAFDEESEEAQDWSGLEALLEGESKGAEAATETDEESQTDEGDA